VLLDGPSSKAGIEAGDFIIAFNGVKVTNRRSLQFEVAMAAPDQEATLDLIHDGRRKQVKVALGKLDLPGLAGSRRIERPRVEGVLEGVKMVNLTTSVRNQYSIPPDAEGKVCVTEVRSGTPAYEAGLREGCVILEANDRPVESVDEVMASVQGAGRDRVLLRVRGTNAVVRFMMITIER
jgi:serine protease Do